MNQAEASGQDVARIKQQGEAQSVFLAHLLGIAGEHGGNGDQLSSGILDLRQGGLQSVQLRVAERSPEAAKKVDDQRPAVQQLL